MLDYIKLGRMKAEFEEACRQIAARAGEAETAMMRSAWSQLLRGVGGGRDAALDRARAVPKAFEEAKMAAWYRIGEKHGLSRAQAFEALRHIAQ